MNSASKVFALSAAVCVLISTAGGQQGHDPQALSEKAGKAEAAGDRITALRCYTDAIKSLRQEGAPREKYVPLMIERDRLETEIIAEMAESAGIQEQIVALQTGIAKKLQQTLQIDIEVQDRVKKNENLIKDIETILLAATSE